MFVKLKVHGRCLVQVAVGGPLKAQEPITMSM